MLKPSKHCIRYDAVTYQELGFTTVEGNVRNLSKKPRYWRINVVMTIDKTDSVEIVPISFNSDERFKLSELGQFVNKEIHKKLGNLSNCTSCIVSAYILTEGGK